MQSVQQRVSIINESFFSKHKYIQKGTSLTIRLLNMEPGFALSDSLASHWVVASKDGEVLNHRVLDLGSIELCCRLGLHESQCYSDKFHF